MSNTYVNETGGERAKRVVKRDPQIGIGWFASIAYACIFLFNVASTIAVSSFMQHARSANSFASLRFDLTNNITMSIFWGLLCLLYFLRLLYVLKMNRKRQAAARGDTSLIAGWQPETEGGKVASPLVIKYRMGWQSSVIVVGIVALGFALVFGMLSIPFFIWGNQVFGDFLGSFDWIPVPIGVALFVIICGIVIWSTRTYLNMEVVAFSNGVLKKTSMKEQFIQWQDIRLVAIDSKARIAGEQKPIMLEVASKDEFIQFPWVHRKRTWRTLFIFPQPVVPFEVYEEQMQALLRVIVGETRLPLYDLDKREEER